MKKFLIILLVVIVAYVGVIIFNAYRGEPGGFTGMGNAKKCEPIFDATLNNGNGGFVSPPGC